MSESNAHDLVLSAAWAMERNALETVLAIAARENVVTPEALEAYRAERHQDAPRAEVRNGVGIIRAVGPMMRRANLFSAISGATSYDVLRRDLSSLLDDPAVHSILLDVDSPGGEVNGCAELAQAVYDARGRKPITAYVGGYGASAAYWLTSAVDPGRIVISETAMLGSLGVQMAMKDGSEAEAKKGVKSYRFVSSQSPFKNAGPDTDEGAAAIQATVDALAEVFVGAVARNRGVGVETVLSDFGQGGIFVGQAAVAAGLADRIGDFESVLAELSAARSSAPIRGGRQPVQPRGHMDNQNGSPGAEQTPETTVAATPAIDVAAEVARQVAAAQAAERTRIGSLTRLANAHGVAAADLTGAIESGSTVEAFALKIAEQAEAKTTGRLEALRRDETEAGVIPPAGGAEPKAATVDDLVAQIHASAALAAGGSK